jgi:hypothetical protein
MSTQPYWVALGSVKRVCSLNNTADGQPQNNSFEKEEFTSLLYLIQIFFYSTLSAVKMQSLCVPGVLPPCEKFPHTVDNC